MDYFKALDRFFSKYECLFGLNHTVEVLFCILHIKEGENEGNYNLLTLAFGDRSGDTYGPSKIGSRFRLVKDFGVSSAVTLNDNTSLFLWVWKPELEVFKDWLYLYDIDSDSYASPVDGSEFCCRFVDVDVFRNYDNREEYYSGRFVSSGELKLYGDRQAIFDLVGDEKGVRKALVVVNRYFGVDLRPVNRGLVGGVFVSIPDRRLSIRWRGVPDVRKKGFLVKLWESDPGVTNRSLFLIRDIKGRNWYQERQLGILSKAFYIPGFLPDNEVFIELIKDGDTLYTEKAHLMKECKVHMSMVTGERVVEFDKDGEKETVRTTIHAPAFESRFSGDKTYDVYDWDYQKEKAESAKELYIIENDNKEKAEVILKELIENAERYIKIWDAYLSAWDLSRVVATLKSTAVDIRAITDLRVKPEVRITEGRGVFYCIKTVLWNKVRSTLLGPERLVDVPLVKDRTVKLVREEKSPELIKANFAALKKVSDSLRLNITIKGRFAEAFKFHDRFLIVDDRVWSLGASINSIGDDFSVIIRVPKGEIVERFFDNLWYELEEIN